jgi:hypothetical protein
LLAVAGNLKGAGLLDFVTAWHLQATAYADGSTIDIAFVSTNSICQGEQVGILWAELLARGWQIAFAHRTFRWNNEARGVAAVHCIIVGLSRGPRSPRRLFDYDHVGGDPQEIVAGNINPYLVDAPNALLPNRSKPLCDVPTIGIGNKPIDGGHYLFSTEERDAFVSTEPGASPWFRRWLGSDEFINGWERWCLFLRDCPPQALRAMPMVLERVQAVRRVRHDSKSESTRKLAETPTRFHVENVPTSTYLVVPKVSSERRAFVPIGFEQPATLCSDLVFVVPAAGLMHLGLVQSTMHMAWLRNVGGRLKSDYRYSAGIVYNNFPWPEPLDDKARAAIEAAAQGVLDARAAFPGSTLADLYDPLTMPPTLVRAHQQLDRAVDAAYINAEKTAGRKAPKLGTDAERVAFLFERYQALTSLLPTTAPKKRRRAG